MANYYGTKNAYSVEQLRADIYKYQNSKFGAFPKNLAIGWMDFYVANEKPDTIEKWVDDCLKIDKIQKEIKGVKQEKNGKPVMVIDKKLIRKLFLETYFPDNTDEKVEERKKIEANRTDEEKGKDERTKLIQKLKKLSR